MVSALDGMRGEDSPLFPFVAGVEVGAEGGRGGRMVDQEPSVSGFGGDVDEAEGVEGLCLGPVAL